MSWIGYALGFLAAVSNAAASVFQRVANKDETDEARFSWQLVKDLLHKPVWFAGVACMTLSFVLQASGLGFATLAAVEPLLVLELPLTLLASRLWLGARLDRQAKLSIAGMTGGTIALIAFLGPSQGRSTGIRWYVWLVAILVTVAAIGACYAFGRREGDPRARAAILGVGTGIAYGLAAAMTKGMTTQYASGGVVGIFASWQFYAAVATGVFAVWLQQNAVGTERLVIAQPGITLSDPYTSILWGALVFDEPMRGGFWILLAILAGVAMSVSAVFLSRAGVISSAPEPDEPGPPGTDDGAADEEKGQESAERSTTSARHG